MLVEIIVVVVQGLFVTSGGIFLVGGIVLSVSLLTLSFLAALHLH